MDENNDEILTVKQFAKKIKTTRQAVHKMIKDGRILAFRLSDNPNGRLRVKASEVERLISWELHKRNMEEK